ncbi:MAG: hypothetical protein VB118_11395 [Oscillospiraceae bacterium]|nr:hypothetical protein [Oscillospiraceae bacterium]
MTVFEKYVITISILMFISITHAPINECAASGLSGGRADFTIFTKQR